MDHMQGYKSVMELLGASDIVLCRAFFTILRKTTRDWYNKLPSRSIHYFKQLARDFVQQFVASRCHRKNPVAFM